MFAEPCCGTAVMTLNNPEPAPREVICDLNAYICNFYRSLRADPDAVAYWADWPTNHHDLTARHRWLLAQGPELSERMTADPDDFDPKIAGWWVWGQSSWIGHGWCDGTNWDQVPDMPAHGGHKGVAAQRRTVPVEDKRPQIEPRGGGSGVQQQRDNVPHVKDKVPLIVNHDGGRGVQQQRDQIPWDQVPNMTRGKGVSAQRDSVPGVKDQMPFAGTCNGKGQGVQQQREHLPHDKVPRIKDAAGGQGVQQQRDQIPHIHDHDGGKGVSMQRVAVGDQRPMGDKGTGQGVSMQRAAVPREGMPHVQAAGKGRGVNMQRVEYPVPREGMPVIAHFPGGQGVQMQREGKAGPRAPAIPGLSDAHGVLDGSRLRPWFRAIAQRLSRVIILNRSWESALTPSVLQQTPSSLKPSVGVFLDPPYRTTRADGGKRSTGLYQGDNDTDSEAVARATYEWAVNGRNKLGELYADKYRIVYCMHEGDFDVPPGWTAETMGFSGHRNAAKKEKAVDQVIFSPACVPVPTDPQAEFAW